MCICVVYNCICSMDSVGNDFLIQVFYYSNLIGLQDFSVVKHSWLVGYEMKCDETSVLLFCCVNFYTDNFYYTCMVQLYLIWFIEFS